MFAYFVLLKYIRASLDNPLGNYTRREGPATANSRAMKTNREKPIDKLIQIDNDVREDEGAHI